MVEVKTKVDESTYQKLNNLNLRKNIVLFIIATVLLIVSGAMLIILEKYIAGSVVIVFGVIFVPGLVIMSKTMQALVIKKNPVIDEIINTIVFEDEYAKVETLRNGEKMSAKFGYGVFYSCYETKDHIFLFLRKNEAFVIPFTDIISGDAAELCVHIRHRLKNKYKKLGFR